ncbi:MAG: hypothetical protein JWN41_846 [Thermoleophilia bacterium]|nr:hypothetical protein [Thermoleophilia bacterium]
MTRLHAIRRPVSPFASTLDAARVRVVLHTSSGNVELGNADEARRDRRLTAAERAAVANLVEAIRLLRTRDRLLGIDDAGTGVKLVLRDAEATASGPYASEGQIAVGAKNALASRS